MVKALNPKLKRTIGITFSYKEFFSEFLHDVATNQLIMGELSAPQQALIDLLVQKYDLVGPSMGFSAKQYAYEALEIACAALVGSADVGSAQKALLTKGILDVARYVGLEGEGDFNFMVATYNLSEVIAGIIGESIPIISPPFGGVASFRVFDGGSGYTNGLATEFTLVSTEPDDTDPAEVTLDVVGTSIVLGTYEADVAGDGFFVGQIVTVEDLLGNVGDAYDTPALAIVEAIV